MKRYLYTTISTFSLLLVATLGFAQGGTNWLVNGDSYYKQANFEEALKSYNIHIENNPNDPLGYLRRARLNDALGNATASKLDYKLAENLNPLSHMYIDASLRSNYYAEKSYKYNTSQTDDPFTKSPIRRTDYIDYVDKLLLNHNSDSLISIVVADIIEKDMISATANIEEITENESNIALIHDLRGLIKLKTGDIDSAIVEFTKAIEYAPNFAIAYHNRAICYKLQDEYELAKEDLNAAIAINDELPMFFFTFAKLNQKNDNIESAKKNYQKAIAIDNDYKEASTNYSQLLKNIGDYDASMEYLSDASDLQLNSSEQHYLKANLHFVYGEFEDALHHFTEYISEFPDDKDALYNIGLTKLLLREYDEGCDFLSESLENENNQKRQEIYDSYCSKFFDLDIRR